MIKILHIISDSNIGGAGIFVLNLAKGIDKEKFELAVALPKKAALIPLLEKTGCKVIPCDIRPDRSFDRKAVSELKKVIKAVAPNIVHTHGSLSGRIAARLAGRNKIVFSKHTISSAPKGFDKALVGIISNATCDAAIACSKCAAQNLIDCGTARKKIQVVYNGCEQVPPVSEQQREELRAQYGIKPDEVVFCMVARLAKVKDHETFLKAIKSAGLPNAKYIIAGGGELEDDLIELAEELEIEDKCIFTGQIPGAEKIYQLSDVFVLSSRMENLPISVLEAMSIGLPIIASAVGGIPEMLDEKSAMLFSAGDEEELAAFMNDLYSDDKLRAAFGNEAKAVYLSRFTLQTFTEGIQKVYTGQCKKH